MGERHIFGVVIRDYTNKTLATHYWGTTLPRIIRESSAPSESSPITKVIDGDIIELASGDRVRLIG
jgi:hypothetical protein